MKWRNSKLSDTLGNFFNSGCIIGIVLYLLIPLIIVLISKYNRNIEEQLEKEKKEREEFVKDSLAHDPHYQDSIRSRKEKSDAWFNRVEYYNKIGIVGIVYGNDSVYHSCFHEGMRIIPDDFIDIETPFLIDEADNIRFISGEEASIYNIRECETCEEIKEAYDDYIDGTLINVEDAKDYVDDF